MESGQNVCLSSVNGLGHFQPFTYDYYGGSTPLKQLLLERSFYMVEILQQGQAGTTLVDASVTAFANVLREYKWTINKSVSPSTFDLFVGDSATANYTISVTKTQETDKVFFSGQVCVTNGGDIPTENLQIMVRLTNPSGSVLYGTNMVNVSGNSILDPGERGCYPYTVTFTNPANAVAGTYKVTADITITNHSGFLGIPYGPSPSATAVLDPNTPTQVVNNEINVDDTNGGSFPFANSGSVSYTRTFTCGEGGTFPNTATIRETGQSSSASVTVNCYRLEVTKTADTEYTTSYNWAIDKSATHSSLTFQVGQEAVIEPYTVTVTPTGTNSGFIVSGTITVTNPAPMAATITSLSDVVTPAGGSGVGAVVTSSSPFPVTIPANSSVTFDYTATLPTATPLTTGTNVATATLQNTPTGTTSFSGTTNFNFGNATVTEIDECATVTDTFAGTLGTVCVGTGPFTFNYTRTFGPYTACQPSQTFTNTATVTATDTGASASDSWSIVINVPCNGCTLTIGYWRTHLGNGPQPDRVSAKLPILLGTPGGPRTVTIASANDPNPLVVDATGIFNFQGTTSTPDASNGINRLYAQLLAAKLNIAYGADNSVIQTTINAADAFLANNNSLNWAGLSRAQRNLVNAWQSALDAYNNGVLPGGPSHCFEFNPVGDVVDDGPADDGDGGQTPGTDCCCCQSDRRYKKYKRRYLKYKRKYEQCMDNSAGDNRDWEDEC
jgi:hypothetical protein